MKIIRNEEKAQEICEKNKRFKVECSSMECYLSVMEMAKWKDEQYAKAFAPILIELDELKHQVKSLLP
jgi:hypothetical protein